MGHLHVRIDDQSLFSRTHLAHTDIFAVIFRFQQVEIYFLDGGAY